MKRLRNALFAISVLVFASCVLAQPVISYSPRTNVTLSGTISFTATSYKDDKGTHSRKTPLLNLDKAIDVKSDPLWGKVAVSGITQIGLNSRNYQIDDRWKNQHVTISGFLYFGDNRISLIVKKMNDNKKLTQYYSEFPIYKIGSMVELSGRWVNKKYENFQNESAEPVSADILVLDHPINAKANTDNLSFYAVNEVEIVQMSDMSRIMDLSGKHVRISGKLEREENDPHINTPIYLQVSKPENILKIGP